MDVNKQKFFHLAGLAQAGLWLLLTLGGTAGHAEPAKTPNAGPPYTLMVVPRQSRIVLQRQWSPFAQALSRELGREVQLVIPVSFGEFESLLAQGRADLAYMDPYQAVVHHRRPGYRPLLRDGSKKLVGILVVRDDHPARRLADLPRPARIGFPDPNAFGASLYIRAVLSEREKLRYHPRYLGTHANVIRHVLHGQVDAGGSVAHTLEREPPEVRARLRVLYQTPPFATHPLSAHPRLSASERRAIINAVQRLSRQLLTDIDMREPVIASYERDYRPLEALQLERYYDHRGQERRGP